MDIEKLDKRFLDKLNLDGYCPGFNLWKVTVKAGHEYAGDYLVAGDHGDTTFTRLFFATNGAIRPEHCDKPEFISTNPDADKWHVNKYGK